MKSTTSKWVLGHKIVIHETDAEYDLVVGTTPPKTQGPPPHHHSKYIEVFIVIEGEMTFIKNGKSILLTKGKSISINPNDVHTFSNETTKDCSWVNIHSPKGFRQFFEKFGIDDDQQNAQKESVSQTIIAEVIGTAADFDMQLHLS